MVKKIFYVVFVFIFSIALNSGMSNTAQGSDKDLEKLVKDQAQLIEQLSLRVKALEEKKYTDVGAMPLTLNNIAPKATWAERMKIKGDFLYRHETSNAAGRRHNLTQAQRDSRGTTRNRHRIRARVGLFAEINEDIDFAFQIASGSPSPVSGYQTLSDHFESKNIYLDLAYITWHPEDFMGHNVKGFKLFAGKMKNPFYRPQKSSLIWDGEVRPEGISAEYKFNVGEMEICVNGGGFWVDEDSNDVDSNLWGVQGYFITPFIDKGITLVGGITYYDYGSIKDQALYDSDGFGNTTYFKPLNTTELLAADFEIIEGFTEVRWNMFELPWVVYGDFVGNAAVSQNRMGYLFGVKVGKCKKVGSWQFGYDWRRLDSDCVYGVFTDSSFAGGRTDAKGSRFLVNYQLAKHTQLGAFVFVNKTGLEDGDGKQYKCAQFDLKVKF